MKILIYGTGAVGGFYGSHLVNAGMDVTFACRSNYDAVKANGIQINSATHSTHIKSPRVVSLSELNKLNPADLIIVTSKSMDPSHLQTLGPILGPDTGILLLQNGIYIEEPVRLLFPDTPIFSGLAFVCLTQAQPGVIEHLAYGRLTIGKYPSGTDSRLAQLATAFESQNISCKVSESIQSDRWKKLLWNAAFNPLSVICHGAATQRLISTPEQIDLVQNIMKEVVTLANADGYSLPSDAIERNIRDTLNMPAYKTSMLVDYENGRPLEIDAILGNAIQFAAKHTIPVPYLQTLHTLLSTISTQ